MELCNILNDMYRNEIHIKKVRLSAVNRDDLCDTEKFELDVLNKVVNIDEVFSNNGLTIDYKPFYSETVLDSSYLNDDEWRFLKTIIHKEIPLVLKTRIEGVLCYINLNKCIDIVSETVNDYILLLNVAVEKEEWYTAKVSAIMAISLSEKLGKGKELFTNAVSSIKLLTLEMQLDKRSALFALSVVKKLAVLNMVNADECANIIKNL